MRIIIFSLLKNSQINYKVIPLAHSNFVEKVIIFRKVSTFLNEPKVKAILLPKYFRFKVVYWLFTSIYGVYLIKSNKVDIIINYNILPHGINAFVASKLTKKPVIFCEINEDTIKYHKNFFLKKIINRVLSNAQLITVPGNNTFAYWQQCGFKNIIQQHSTINPDVFNYKTGLEKRYDFIFVGEFDTNKRPDIILEAFILIRKSGINAKLCLIGYGVLSESLKHRVLFSEVDGSVDIISTNEVLPYLQVSKIFVMSSKTEGLPCALMEAMSCELIPIVTPVGDIKDLVKPDFNGFFHNGTAENLSSMMQEVLHSYENLIKIRKNARNYIVENYSYDVATKKWNYIFEKVLTSKLNL